MELPEDETLPKNAKKCSHLIKNTLLLYEYERTIFSCGYYVIKRKTELTKRQRKN